MMLLDRRISSVWYNVLLNGDSWRLWDDRYRNGQWWRTWGRPWLKDLPGDQWLPLSIAEMEGQIRWLRRSVLWALTSAVRPVLLGLPLPYLHCASWCYVDTQNV